MQPGTTTILGYKDALIDSMIAEDSDVTIRDYLELLRELEAIELSTNENKAA